MSTTLSATISSISKILFQNSQALGTTFSGTVLKDYEKSLSSTDITKLYFQNYASSSPTSIDLTALTDAYGSAISFATIKHLMIVNNDATVSITVGGGTNGLVSALPAIVAGGAFNLTTNFTVDGTHKILLITPASGTPSVDVVIAGI